MITVSDAWKDIQQRFLLPESFVEIECGITDSDAMSVATATGTNEALFSGTESLLDSLTDVTAYATLEHNLWALDGSQSILEASGEYSNAGYVSNIESTGSVTLSFPAVRTSAISGITITWSEKHAEYAKVFSVVGMNGTDTVGEITVTDNTSVISNVFLPLENYDSIVIEVHEWNKPNRRVRIEKVVVGLTLKFDKSDLLGFTHEMDGDLLSGKIPKYSIEFTLDNSDGRWDPNNPSGMAQYLSERQPITVKYGLDVDGTIEWVMGGKFYLSEWYAPPNGLEARFVARDGFEFLIGIEWWSALASTISFMVASVTRYLWPDASTITYDESLPDYMIDYTPSYTEHTVNTSAEIVQKCANAACAILRCDREGNLYIEPLNTTDTGYTIPLALSYSYPEISLSKPLKEVSVDYGETTSYLLSVATSGERQTLSNEFVKNEENADTVAQWVRDVLKNRKTISGEFRADPRLDLYDIVKVEDRYGKWLTVAITNIKYTYNGAFRGTYTGRILEEG